jgi:hypothetical protein
MDRIGRNENDANWPVPADGNGNMVNVLGTRYNPGLRSVIDRENEETGLNSSTRWTWWTPTRYGAPNWTRT